MINSLLNKEKEFLIVRSCTLNTPNPEFEQETENIAQLQKFTGQRKPVPVFEGDILEMKGSSDIILMHKTFTTPSKKKFESLRSENYAAYLDEVLEKAANYNPDTVLCLEPKLNITSHGIFKTIQSLEDHGLNRAYFDSFFGEKLYFVEEINKLLGTSHPTSYHVIATINQIYISLAGKDCSPNFITVPSAMSFGKFNKPIIYGAVGSTKKLEKLAQRPNVLGVYLRTKEKWSAKMLFNSFLVEKRS